jgi:hypothetical protein
VNEVCPVWEARPDSTAQSNVNPVNGAPEGSLYVRVIVCEVGADPNNCGGKLRKLGVKATGAWQAFDVPKAKQMFPKSARLILAVDGHALVFTRYPVPVECRMYPFGVESNVTGKNPFPPWLTWLG